MRVFLAGGSGVIGMRLIPMLSAAGHDIAGMTRTPGKANRLLTLGAWPVVCDVFDLQALCDAVGSYRPDVVLHQLTDLPDDQSQIAERAGANARMRREGTRNLLVAAKRALTPHFVAQSVAWQLPGDAGAAVEEHEQAVLDAGGVIIRYGQFYGPGTYFESELPPHPRVEISDAARRTLSALKAPSGVVVIAEEPPG